MKALAVLATIAVAAMLSMAAAGERTANLPAPALPEVGEILREAPAAHALSVPSSYFSSIEIERIRNTVRGQLNALSQADGAGAFAYLAPAAQAYYGKPDRFLVELARNLAPMLRAERFALAQMEREATDAVQVVVFTGPTGREWIGRFTVERQSDGDWAIRSCRLESADGPSV